MICHCVFCGVAFSTKHKRKYCDACRKVVNKTKTHIHGEEERIKYAYEKTSSGV
jgi:predicted nucleic acid-binding Zn ribbon protein